MFDHEAEVRVHVGCINGELAYWALYTTDERGQWNLSLDHTTDPFALDEDRRRHLGEVVKAWCQYAGTLSQTP